MALLHTSCALPGAVPEDKVPGPDGTPLSLPEPTAISPDLWVARSVHYPSGGKALWIRFKAGSQPPPAYAIAHYWGDSTDSLDLPYSSFVTRYAENAYVLGSPHHQFGVVGDPASPASYANEGFYSSNAFFWFIPEVRAFFLCLKGKAVPGVAYEVMPNYGEQGKFSGYWTPERRAALPPATASVCESFYPSHPKAAGERKVYP